MKISARFASVSLLVAMGLAGSCAPAAPRAEAPSAPAPRAPAPRAEAPRAAAPAAPAVSFAGKTVSILIPYTVGGAADIMARQMLPFMGKHFPGDPSVIVQNMPGAGGIVGENWVYNVAPRDGTVIGQFSTALADAIFAPEKVQFDLAKLRWLGGVSETTVAFVHTSLGIKNAEELLQVSKPIFLGESSAQSTRGMNPRLLLRLLEKDHKFVAGYGSSGDTRAALRRGELNMAVDSLSGYFPAVKPMIEEGVVVPLAQEGRIQDGQIVRDPRLPDVPTYTELAVKLKGEAIKQRPEYQALEVLARMGGIQRGWVYAPGVPEGTFAAMAAAFDKVLADPELLQTFEQTVGFKPIVLTGAEAQRIVASVVNLLQTYPDGLEILRRLAQETA